jgi:hypothetical protein
MIERLREYDAEVVRMHARRPADAIAAQLAASGKRIFVAPPGLPTEWLAPGFDWKIDNGLSTPRSRKAKAWSPPPLRHRRLGNHRAPSLQHEGRRVLTLLPDWHLMHSARQPGG